ncbi:indole-3-glycerol phosphate synthase [Pelagirhabdus alkalitolerans]|uniref:Indole-3-glycerol phosphate synthase n=1 Tax=Pelagirhabdus alkalitolerans TaxID=1612202 RepID=A0A1G6GJ35_9BACI|nr:indole-3-glycerol phosphate synthase TrpC [Pelagirhabdus alkalitolerans]SDB82032.1 indole-3-glycerol phosphate synthase [Pelagirhabdus alkalitolerans]
MILDDIIKEKKKEVARLKQDSTINTSKRQYPVRSFFKMARSNNKLSIIAEFKRASPSKGVINADLDPKVQASTYEKAGASMISVLTDTPFFKGDMDDLIAVRETVNIPILNKDFIIDPVQIDRAYQHGADVILLIVRALSTEQLASLYQHAKRLGLEVLVEVHDEQELQAALDIDATLIGINNRNLDTFEVDLKTTEDLAKMLNPEDHLIISESGMKTTEDVLRVKKAGAEAILVGETMMRSDNLTDTFELLSGEGDRL